MGVIEIIKTYASDIIPMGFLSAGGVELIIALALTVATNERRYRTGRRYLLKRIRNFFFIAVSITAVIAGCYFGNETFRNAADSAVRYIAAAPEKETVLQSESNADIENAPAEAYAVSRKVTGSISGYANRETQTN